MRGRLIPPVLSAVCAVAPLLAVVAARTFGGPRPAAAAASKVKDVKVNESKKLVALPSSGEIFAPARTMVGAGLASPFYAPAKGESPVINLPVADEPTKQEIPTFELTSVINGVRPLAVVNGRMRSQGQTVAPGWTVRSIDPVAGRVVVSSVVHGDVTLQLRTRK